MWTIIIVLILALILLTKISGLFSESKPLDITSNDTGLSSSDLERFNKFRKLIQDNTHTERTFWERVGASTSVFGNVFQGSQVGEAQEAGKVADVLRLVENKKLFGEVYRQRFNETIPTAIINSFGEGLYLTISTAVDGFGEFL